VFEVGTLLADKYRVDRVIGQGGMGVVVAATHLHLQQRVALKFLSPDIVHGPAILERFVREARASAQLRGEHVCRVSDVGTFANGAAYIVMELLEGSDLASLVERHGPLPVQRAADYVLQACVGIAEAHALGIIHRDLKPANLFLTARPDGAPLIKVLDFGIAKAQADHSFNLTQTSAVLGSPGYMSPEQLRSARDVDARSDIWAIGVVLYELVSGRPPFTGDSITELALRIAMDPPPPLVGPLPHGFDQLVHRCLAKDPAQRYPDLANLAHALAAYAGAAGWDLANAVSRLLHVEPPASPGPQGAMGYAGPVTQVLGPMTAAGSRPAAPTTLGAAASAMLAARPRDRRRAVFGGVAAAAVIAGVVAAVALGRGARPAVPAAAAAASTPQPAAVAPPAPPPPPAEVSAPPAAAPPAIAPDASVAQAGSADARPGDGEAEADHDRPSHHTVPTKPRGPRDGARPGTRPPEDLGESRF
jgi:serine/threonine-protein kinase